MFMGFIAGKILKITYIHKMKFRIKTIFKILKSIEYNSIDLSSYVSILYSYVLESINLRY